MKVLERENISSLKATFRHYGSLNFDNYLGEIFCSSAGLKSCLDKGLFEMKIDKFYQLAAGYWEQRMEAENGI